MRVVNLVKMAVEQVPAYREDYVRYHYTPNMKPLEPLQEDQPVEYVVTEFIKPVMDIHHITGFGERETNYIVYTKEVEQLIGIPCDLMHKQHKEIIQLKEKLFKYMGLDFWGRIKFLFGIKPS